MRKVRCTVMGLGAYDCDWAKVAAKNPNGEPAAAVDCSEAIRAAADLPAGKYADMDPAIEVQKPAP